MRAPSEADFEPLAALWETGWHEAHDALVPAALTRLRTPESFRDRMRAMADDVLTDGPEGAPLGFVAIKRPDELYQLYVSPAVRGTGLARRLLAAAEARLAAGGATRAFLLCAVGNDRAQSFYESCGWTTLGIRREAVDTPRGPFAFDLLRLEKSLGADRAQS